MLIGDFILLPKDNSLTAHGVNYEKQKGNNIPLSKYKILDIYWETYFYPIPHSSKRIKLQKSKGICHDKYMESVSEILLALKN